MLSDQSVILKEARCKKGITPYQLSKQADVPIKDIMNYENGEYYLDFHYVQRMCKVLELNIIDVFWPNGMQS